MNGCPCLLIAVYPVAPMDVADLVQRAEGTVELCVCCSACGRKLGLYEARHEDGEITLQHVEPSGVERTANVGGVRKAYPEEAQTWRGYRSGAAAHSVVQFDGHTTYRWSCGCGADIQRRADRLGRIEVDDRGIVLL